MRECFKSGRVAKVVTKKRNTKTMRFVSSVLYFVSMAAKCQALRLYQDEQPVVTPEEFMGAPEEVVEVPEEVVVEVVEEVIEVPEEIVVNEAEAAPEVEFAADLGSDLFLEEVAVLEEPAVEESREERWGRRRRRGSRRGEWRTSEGGLGASGDGDREAWRSSWEEGRLGSGSGDGSDSDGDSMSDDSDSY